MLYLENAWHPDPAPAGALEFALHNLSDDDLTGFTLSVTTITRLMPDHEVTGARFLRRVANFHEFAMPDGDCLRAGGVWRFRAEGLNRSPYHRNDAVKSAWITVEGAHHPAQIGDLMHGADAPKPPPPRLPEGRLTLPFALLPWPNAIDAAPGDAPVILHLGDTCTPADRRLTLAVDALHRRLFPTAPRVFQLSPTPGSREVAFATDAALPEEGYRLQFADRITLTAASDTGRRHGLIALAQMLHGAMTDSEFRFPATGQIEDAPRYGWRACHLDCARHFWTIEQVKRVVDILAWHRMNLFHWHLTDDEGWRAQILAYPQLTDAGAHRSADTPQMPPQLGDGPARQGGFYTQDQMRALVAHASAVGVEVMPEIETPGHAACIAAALPHLVDPDEVPRAYHSIQGYPNNGWNPAVPESFVVLETIIDELCAIFSSRYFHIGGDEVARNAWLDSPKARILMQREGLAGTFELQAWFLGRIKAMLTARGKVLVGWNEVAHGGGVAPEDTLLMAWERPDVGVELARLGYDVVMTPGQAYYLDMVQGADWLENGAGWAGPVPPQQTYAHEAEGDFPPDLRHHMRGVQACIWCEHFTTPAWFNDLVFPRLSAVAEAAWTLPDRKDWHRFARQVRLHPTL